MKKLLSILLALVMILSLAATAFAADDTTGGEGGTSGETATPNKGDNNNNGTLTINNTIAGIEYKIWQIFVLESYDADADAYSYTVHPNWKGFVEEYPNSTRVNANGYVENFSAYYADEAVTYAEENNIAPADAKSSEGTSVVFSGLNLGYYVVDSSVGAVCALTTTDPNAVINEKNIEHKVVKQVWEDYNDSDETNDGWTNRNDASTGETVEFKATITISGPARDLVLHDTMDDGLTFGSVTKVTLNEAAENEGVVADTNYIVKQNPVHAKEDDTTETHTFDVEFAKAFTDSLSHQDVITVYYTATLNDNAVVEQREENKVYLSYINANDTTSSSATSTTTTWTWKLPVFKWTADDNHRRVGLAGATFTLYTLETENADGTFTHSGEIKLKLKEGETNIYRVDPNGTVTEITTDSTGEFTIEGLDSGIYYLKEVDAPEGYNLLKEAVEVTIHSSGTITVNEETVDTVQVQNNAGTELPETGGMGTTLIYTLGAILAVGSLILLVVKKRMSAAE